MNNKESWEGEDAMFYCPRCRGIIKSEDKFCPSCGEKINPEVFQEKSTDKEDREKTENEPLKENLITNTSKQKFTVENLKVPLLKNKKFIFGSFLRVRDP